MHPNDVLALQARAYCKSQNLQKLTDRWNKLTLTSIVQNASIDSSENESEERLVGTFLNDNGKLQRYLELARSGDKRGYNTYLEAAFARPLGQLEPEFQLYLATIRGRWKELLQIPRSQVFSSSADYQKFLGDNATLLRSIVPRRD